MQLIGPALSGPADLTELSAPAGSERPDKTALVSATGTWTWRELDRAVHRLSANLLAMGLRPGDRVASLMPNRNELLLHYLACLKAGLVATPLNYRYTPAEIDYALGVSGTVILLTHAERAADIKASALTDKLPLGLISYGGPIDGAVAIERLIEDQGPDNSLPEPNIHTPAFVFFTSGSTGKPKGVTHSLASFGSVAASFAQAMKLTHEDVVLPGASMSHVGALSTALAGLSVGAQVVVPQSFDGDELLPLFREHRPSVLVMLPSALIAVQRDHAATRDDFASLRLCALPAATSFLPISKRSSPARLG
jgi:long-chain acyl-CoA synthetase